VSPIEGITTRKHAGFAEIGRIRKGIVVRPEGRKPYPKEVDYFRIVIDEGEDLYAEQVLSVYGEKPKRLNVLLPFAQVERIWDAYYEAYAGGRLIARSDGVEYLKLIDNQTGELIALNGEYIAGDLEGKPALYDRTAHGGRGEVVGYTRTQDGTQGKEIYMAARGRLKVWLADFDRLAYLTLITGSIRDLYNLSDELESIRLLAEGAGKSMVGVPCILRRRPENCQVTSSDGGTLKTTKHFVHIEPQPEWVQMIKAIWRADISPDQLLAAATGSEVSAGLIESSEFEPGLVEGDDEPIDADMVEIEAEAELVDVADYKPKDGTDYTTYYELAKAYGMHAEAVKIAESAGNAIGAYQELCNVIKMEVAE
jgi:hypothetical protein